jgi:hypothetical protein
MFGSMKSSTAVRIFRQPSDKQRRPKGAVGPVKKK